MSAATRRSVATFLFLFAFLALTSLSASAQGLKISEFRLFGPNGAEDEFIEIYNDSDNAHTVSATNGGSGYAIANDATPNIEVIPNGTVIPARGHYLLRGNDYSLTEGWDQTIASDIPNNAGIALFSDDGVRTLATRLDAAGSTLTSNALYFEGNRYTPPVVTATPLEYSMVRRYPGSDGAAPGACFVEQADAPQDTNDNAADFFFVVTTIADIGSGPNGRLGAPNPQGTASPLSFKGFYSIAINALEGTAGRRDAPNFVYDAGDPSGSAGAIRVRRVITNNTGFNIETLRFTVVDMTTNGQTSSADLRLLTSVDNGSVTLEGGGMTSVSGLTLGNPTQINGGGYNTYVTDVDITPGTPLAAGNSINVEFLLGVETAGDFRFFVTVDAVNPGGTPGSTFGIFGNTATGLDLDCPTTNTAPELGNSIIASPDGDANAATETINEGETVSVDLVASDIDHDMVAIDVDWGDGSAVESFGPGTEDGFGLINFLGVPHTYGDGDGGTYTITLTGDDSIGTSTNTNLSVTVNNVAPDTTVNFDPASMFLNEGDTLEIYGDATDAGFEGITIDIDWGNNTTSEFLGSTSDSSPSISWSFDNVYGLGSCASYDIEVTVTDADGDSTTYSTTNGNFGQVQVNCPPDVTIAGLTSSSGTDLEGDTFTLTYDLVDGDSDPVQITVDWGDGSTPTVTTETPGNGLTIDHVYRQDTDTDGDGTLDAPYTITITADDLEGAVTDSDTTTIGVNNVAPSVTSYVVDDVNENAGTATAILHLDFTDPGTTDAQVLKIDWESDGTFEQTVNIPAESDGAYEVDLTHNYPDDDPTATASDAYTIDIEIDDDDETTTSTDSNTVSNVDPVTTFSWNDDLINEGQFSTYADSISDQGDSDTWDFEADFDNDGTPDISGSYAGEGSSSSTNSPVFNTPSGPAGYDTQWVVTDDDTGSDTASDNIRVNDIPVIQNVQTTAGANEGDTFTLAFEIADTDTDDNWDIVIDWGDGSTDTVINNVAWSANPTPVTGINHVYAQDTDTNGDGSSDTPFTVTITVTDAVNAAQDTDTSLSVAVANVAPVINAVVMADGNEGATVVLTSDFDDPGLVDNHTVTIDWGDGSTDTVLNFNGTTLNESFGVGHVYTDDNPTATASDAYTVTVTVEDDDDSDSGTDGTTISNVAPVVSVTEFTDANDIINEGETATLSMTFTDASTTPGDTFTAQIDFNGGGNDDTSNPAEGTFTRNFLYPTPGNFTATLTLTDDDTGVAAGTDLTDTIIVNDIPAISNQAFTTVNEGSVGTLTFRITDTDDTSWDIDITDWGDGTSSLNNSGCTVTLNQFGAGVHGVSCTKTYAQDSSNQAGGDYDIDITVTDTQNLASASTVNSPGATINNVTPVITVLTVPDANENTSLTVSLTFTDPGTQDGHTVNIDWTNDGSFEETVTLGAGVLSTTFTHTYTDDTPTATASDTYTVGVTVTDDDATSTEANDNTTISNVAPVVTGASYADTLVNENENVTFNGTFTETSPLDTFTVEIDWDGNGTFDESFAAAAAATTFSRTHAYATCGDYTARARITDDDTGVSNTFTSSNTVHVNCPPTVTLNAISAVNETAATTVTGTIGDTEDATLTVDINWGDGNTEQHTGVAVGAISYNHTYADDNPSGTASDQYVVTVTVTDSNAATANDTENATVNNVAPTINIDNVVPSPVAAGGTVDITYTVTETNSNDTLNLNIDFGDGTADYVVNGHNTGTFTIQHTYTAVALETITATITDDDTGTDTDTENIDVQDPDFTVDVDPPSATLVRGESETFLITITPTPPPYLEEIHLSCGSLPEGVSCHFSDNDFVPGYDPVQVELEVRTTAPSSNASISAPGQSNGMMFAMVLPTLSFGLFGMVLMISGRTRRSRNSAKAMLLLCVVMLAMLLPACGTGGSDDPDHGTRIDEGTPTGNYTITVTVSSAAGGDSHPVQFTIDVN